MRGGNEGAETGIRGAPGLFWDGSGHRTQAVVERCGLLAREALATCCGVNLGGNGAGVQLAGTLSSATKATPGVQWGTLGCAGGSGASHY